MSKEAEKAIDSTTVSNEVRDKKSSIASGASSRQQRASSCRGTNSRPGHLLTGLPIPIFILSIGTVLVLRIDTVWNPPNLLSLLNILFLTTSSLLIALLAARSYLVGRSLTVLLLGCGMLVMGLGSTVTGPAVISYGSNAGIAIYNTAILLAGLCHLSSTLSSLQPSAMRLRSGWPLLMISYLAAFALVGGQIYLVRAQLWPVHFIDGYGRTTFGFAIINTAVVLFAISALLIRTNHALDESGFLSWYGSALGLIATGLAGVVLLKNMNDPLNWISRFAQYLGGIYMLVAVLTSVRYCGSWLLPLEKALRESEDRYQSLVDLCPDAILVHAGGKYIFANPAAVTLLGASSPAEIVGREVLELVHPDHRLASMDRVERAYYGDLTALTETVLMRLDGCPVDVEVTGAKAIYAGKAAIQIVVRDITVRKRAEKELEYYRVHLEEQVAQQVTEIQRQAQLLGVAHDAIIVRDLDGKIRYWNAGAERMYGYPRDMAVGQVDHHFLQAVLPKPMEEIVEHILRHDFWEGEIVQVRRDGSQITVLSNWVLQRDEQGRPLTILMTNKDITERKGLEQALRESEERFRTAMDNLLDGFAILTSVRNETGKITDFTYEYVNPALSNINRMSKEEQEGKRFLELLPVYRDSIVFRSFCQTADTGVPTVLENRALRDPIRGKVLETYDIRAVKLWNGLAVTIRDVTQKRQSESDLKASEERSSAMFRASPLAMLISRMSDDQFIVVNDSFYQLTGYSQEEAIGHTAQDLKLWANLDERINMFSEIARAGGVRQFLVTGRRKSGEIRRWQTSNTVVTLHGERCLLNFLEDVTDRLRAEEALRASEERFAKAFRASPLAMAIGAHPSEQYLEVNDSFLQLTGYEMSEVIGSTPVGINLWVDCAERKRAIEQFRRNGSIHNLEMKVRHKNGGSRTCLLSVEAITIGSEPCRMVIYDDITERRKMEDEMARLDRLNLVGQVAASLGHEVRNPMQTVRGFLQIFQDEPRYASDLEDLQLMIDELDRANSIITEFLTLAQNKRTPTRRQDLNTILQAIEPLLSTDALKTGCAFNLECGAIPAIILDEKEIRQLVINLVRNAIEAAPTGAVDIRTFMDGEAVVLQVSDTGPGIPAEVLDRLGTPFLTTKEGGTGLGLATSYSIARRHGATMTPVSGPGGTTFTVRFPAPNGVA